jgi:hypothetical protein
MPEEISVATPVFDPFGYDVALPLETNVNAFGFPLRLVTNDPILSKPRKNPESDIPSAAVW